MKQLSSLSALAVLAAVAIAGLAHAQSPANLGGTYKCGPDAKACEWSGATFTVTQSGTNLDVKNDKGAIGAGHITSNITVSMGPPWNMFGVVSDNNRHIEWSNGTVWQKQ